MNFQITTKAGRDVTLLSLFALAVCFTAALITIDGLRINASESAPVGVYCVTHRPLARGVFLYLKMPLKIIAGLPGDTVQVTKEGSYINGKLWPNSAIPRDTHGYIPFPFGTYKLTPHQFWLLGKHPLSWDSRYLGPIPESLISSTAQPLWVEQ
jgi:type IV secretory pathway protease TraF